MCVGDSRCAWSWGIHNSQGWCSPITSKTPLSHLHHHLTIMCFHNQKIMKLPHAHLGDLNTLLQGYPSTPVLSHQSRYIGWLVCTSNCCKEVVRCELSASMKLMCMWLTVPLLTISIAHTSSCLYYPERWPIIWSTDDGWRWFSSIVTRTQYGRCFLDWFSHQRYTMPCSLQWSMIPKMSWETFCR